MSRCQRPKFSLALVFLALTACATPSPDRTAAVDADTVLARFDTLERSLQDWCAYRDVRTQAQFLGLGRVQAMVEELHAHMQAEAAEREHATAGECPPPGGVEFDGKHVLGRAEWVGLPSIGSYFKARLDTGANVSSLSATDITPFERDGENWVRFRLALSKDDVVVPAVREAEFEARVIRHVRIVQASGSDRRPVIGLPMTLGPIEQTVEFTLNDRSHLSFPVLLGRRFMLDIAVIDVGQAYVHPRPEFDGGEPAANAARDQRDDDALEE